MVNLGPPMKCIYCEFWLIDINHHRTYYSRRYSKDDIKNSQTDHKFDIDTLIHDLTNLGCTDFQIGYLFCIKVSIGPDEYDISGKSEVFQVERDLIKNPISNISIRCYEHHADIIVERYT